MNYFVPHFPPNPIPTSIKDVWKYYLLSAAPIGLLALSALLGFIPLDSALGDSLGGRILYNALVWGGINWMAMVGWPLHMRIYGQDVFDAAGELTAVPKYMWLLHPRRIFIFMFVTPTLILSLGMSL